MKPEPITIMLDFITGPMDGAWDDERQCITTFFDVVDNDPEVYRLQRLIIELYHPLWKRLPEGTYKGCPYDFDMDRFKELGPVLLYLIEKLKERLEEINDGSYYIEDRESRHIRRILGLPEDGREETGGSSSENGDKPAEEPKREYAGAAGAKIDPGEEEARNHIRKTYEDIFGVWLLRDHFLAGDYGMPSVGSFSDISEIDYMALYTRTSEYRKTENTAVCFYQFDKYFDGKDGLYNAIKYRDEEALERFRKRFEGVKWIVAPDYSMYGDLPKAQQIDSVYRSRLVGCWLHDATGAEVIPNVRFTLENTFDFAFDGIPYHSNIALGMLGLLKEKENRKMFDEGFPKLIDKVRPRAILVHGFITEENIEDIFGYALERGVKIVVPHSSLDRLKGPNAFYGTKEPFGDIGQ